MSIVSIDYTKQHKGSVFECNWCHRKINTKSKLGQSGLETKNKNFDFCGNCIRKYLKDGNV